MVTLTATLTQNPHNRREACLEVVGPDTFVGRRISLSRTWGGAFASTDTIQDGLMEVARQEAFMALGDACPEIKWA